MAYLAGSTEFGIVRLGGLDEAKSHVLSMLSSQYESHLAGIEDGLCHSIDVAELRDIRAAMERINETEGPFSVVMAGGARFFVEEAGCDQ